MFETSLERTGAGYFDRYLLHNLGAERTDVFTRYGLWDFLAEKKAKGLIRKLGFSFHDKADVLDRLLTEHPEMDFVQLQINYADWDSPTVQSRLCYETAQRHGKPVIIMEPVKGGSLASLPESSAAPMRRHSPQASLASWALRFAASLEGAPIVLSGMSTLEQMQDNLSFMSDFVPLTDEEYSVIHEVQELLLKTDHIPCTDCRYCMKDCPKGIKIAPIFSALNTLKIYGNLARAKSSYGFATSKGGKASDCIGCGQCESVCPQSIAIINTLRQAHKLLG